MKKALFVLIFAGALLCSCGQNSPEEKVMARHVPERMDDFVWENDLIAYRAYGQALEGNPTSPGFDVWVKLPGKLVANEWYEGAKADPDYYHHNHGGKDCYKVAVSLGAGASSPFVDSALVLPPTNWRSYEILESGPEKVVFELNYPAWDVAGKQVALKKRFTLEAGTYFVKVEDYYTGDFDELTIAAGIITNPDRNHFVAESALGTDRVAIWEPASDQSIEPEDGMLGVAVILPGADAVSLDMVPGHAACLKTIRNGECLSYSFGSCWSKGNIKNAVHWFEEVNKQ